MRSGLAFCPLPVAFGVRLQVAGEPASDVGEALDLWLLLLGEGAALILWRWPGVGLAGAAGGLGGRRRVWRPRPVWPGARWAAAGAGFFASGAAALPGGLSWRARRILDCCGPAGTRAARATAGPRFRPAGGFWGLMMTVPTVQPLRGGGSAGGPWSTGWPGPRCCCHLCRKPAIIVGWPGRCKPCRGPDPQRQRAGAVAAVLARRRRRSCSAASSRRRRRAAASVCHAAFAIRLSCSYRGHGAVRRAAARAATSRRPARGRDEPRGRGRRVGVGSPLSADHGVAP